MADWKYFARYPLEVSDSWYRMRIEKMIEDNGIEIIGIKDVTNNYSVFIKITPLSYSHTLRGTFILYELDKVFTNL